MLTITSSHPSHHYHRCLYDQLSSDVIELVPSTLENQFHELMELAEKSDIFHLHWPENMFNGHVHSIMSFISRIKLSGTKIVWTLHNLQPHRNLGKGKELYDSIASMVDATIHHSECGRAKALRHINFNKNCLQKTVQHGYFESIIPKSILQNRTKFRWEIEEEYQLFPASIRLGILGAPRQRKNTREFIEAFTCVHRLDLGFFSPSLDSNDSNIFSQDTRITTLPYSFFEREKYYRRL